MKTEDAEKLEGLLSEVRACRHCEAHLPLGPRPVLRAQSAAKILIAGQAPGSAVHASGVPWDDPSGRRLRKWLHLEPAVFYDETRIAIIPMGLCYPGKGKSGDLPPRKECAQLWFERLLAALPNIEATLLVGQYAQAYYLGSQRKKTLTETVRAWEQYAPRYFPLVHPSPRNTYWLQKNPWFETNVLPAIRKEIARLLTEKPSSKAGKS